MKKLNKILAALVGALISITPFLANTANACSLTYYEAELPDCLKE